MIEGDLCKLTFWHEFLVLQRFLDLLVKRQIGDADRCGRSGEMVQHVMWLRK